MRRAMRGVMRCGGAALLAASLAMLASCKKDVPPDASAGASASTASAVSPPGAASSPPIAAPQGDAFATSRGDFVVTPIHHATLLLFFKGIAIYLDPTKDGTYDGLPKADYVFVTDIHGDHFDPEGIARVKKDDATKEATTIVVGPVVVAEKFRVGATMKNGEKKLFPDGPCPTGSDRPCTPPIFSVEAVPMYNLVRGPSQGKLFHDKGRGNGYVFTFGDKRVYVSGDTECTPEMRALEHIDVAFVCMNLPYTMPPSEAAECVKAFKPKVVFPYHDRDSNLDDFSGPVDKAHASEVRLRKWY